MADNNLECPKCGVVTEFTEKSAAEMGVMIFICPGCGSNVVFYDHKVDIISTKLLKRLIRSGKLRTYGEIRLKMPQPAIGDKEIRALKSVLDNTSDVNDFINKV